MAAAARALGPLLALAAGACGLLQGAPVMDARGESAPRYYFWAHHKCGTHLAEHLLFEMTQELHVPLMPWVYWHEIEQVRPTQACPRQGQSVGVVYMDMQLPMLEAISQNCSGYRAVHLLREARSMLVSSYVYTKHLPFGYEYMDLYLRGKELRKHSIEWGLKNDCDYLMRKHLQQIVDVSKRVRHLPEVMEVRLEDFREDFELTSTAVFEHLLGRGHPKIQDVVRRTLKHNVNAWNSSLRHDVYHVSDSEEKRQVREVVDRMVAEGEPCLTELVDVSRALGYRI